MDTSRSLRAKYRPIWLTALYVILGVTWILVSDWVVSWLAVDAGTLSLLQNIKGVLFILVTGALVYWELKSTADFFWEKEKKIQQLATYPEQSPFVIMEVNSGGVATYCNPSCERLHKKLGVRKPVHSVILPKDFKKVVGQLRDSKLKTAVREVKVNGMVWSEAITRVPDSNLYRVYGIDVTQQKELDKLKSEFVSLASHQLRTPLSGIKWYSEMLLDQLTGPLSEKQQRYIKEVKTSNEKMIMLVNDLLDVSRVEKGIGDVLILERKDVTKLVEEAVGSKQKQAAREGVKLVVVKDDGQKMTALVDEEKIKMVIENLLDNAIKFSPKGGKVIVRVRWVEDKTGVVVEVADRGTGIPKEDQPRVFERFFRAANSLTTPGSGLGLYIVKIVVEAHRGRVWFESKEGEGTTFYVQLRH